MTFAAATWLINTGELWALYLALFLFTVGLGLAAVIILSISNQAEQELGATIFDKRLPAAAPSTQA